MPIFEFYCAKCKKKFELLIRSSGKGRPVCPDCGTKKIERLLSSFAIGGKGSSAGSSAGRKSCGSCSSSSCSTCR